MYRVQREGIPEERVEQMEKTIEDLRQEIAHLKSQKADDILTPKEFAKRVSLNENTVYCWIRKGRIHILPNLGAALRIPMSQFYESEEEKQKRPKRKCSKAEQLKREFEESLLK